MKEKKELTPREQEILDNLAELLPKLDDDGKNYLLGFGEALRFTRRRDDEPDNNDGTRRSA